MPTVDQEAASLRCGAPEADERLDAWAALKEDDHGNYEHRSPGRIDFQFACYFQV